MHCILIFSNLLGFSIPWLELEWWVIICFIWFLVNQAWECTSGRELTWNLLSLFTTSGMLFLEVSLLAFLLQGNNAGGLEAMKRTFGISTLVVGLDILLKVFQLCFLLQVCFSLFKFMISLWPTVGRVKKTHQCSLTSQINLFFHAK